MAKRNELIALGGDDKRKLTTINIAQAIMQIMQYRAGVKYEISHADLFKQLFNHVEQDNLKDWLRWEFTKRAMHYLRTRTKCFVVSRFNNVANQWCYYIPCDENDIVPYIMTLDNNIAKMKSMQKLAQKAVTEKWQDQPWTLPIGGTQKRIK